MINIEDIDPGNSYACKFKVEHMLDQHGELSNGEGSVFELGTYEGFGLINTRDCDNRLLEVTDRTSGKTFVVSWDDAWAVDRVEWVESEDDGR